MTRALSNYIMRKNVEAVIRAYFARKPLAGKTISTDGHTIYSYAIKIAERRNDGSTRVYVEYKWMSPTTRNHISALAACYGPWCDHTDCAESHEMAVECKYSR